MAIAPTHVFTPEGPGACPAVIFYMDGLGIQRNLFEMGQRLADAGYVVLLPVLFYRAGPYEPLEPKKVFAAGEVRTVPGHLFGLGVRPASRGQCRNADADGGLSSRWR